MWKPLAQRMCGFVVLTTRSARCGQGEGEGEVTYPPPAESFALPIVPSL
jgi:hypothetical protein